jgi:hypothetical protein
MTESQEPSYLDRLQHLLKSEVVGLWRQLFKNEPAVDIRKGLMLRMIVQRLQEQEFGELSAASCRRLQQVATIVAADPKAPVSLKLPIKSGTRMIRQWKDQVHVVNVDGKNFEYRGERYESLSEIARLITGTRWSGPLFFGVKAKRPTLTEAR